VVTGNSMSGIAWRPFNQAELDFQMMVKINLSNFHLQRNQNFKQHLQEYFIYFD
jgi:hypothetical protein